MATDEEIEMTTIADRIYSEPDPDPYESELESVVDVHDYSSLGELRSNDVRLVRNIYDVGFTGSTEDVHANVELNHKDD